MSAEATGSILSIPEPRVLTIDPARPFLKTLSASLLDAIERGELSDLSDAVIYLPTRRAVRTLTDELIAADTRSGAKLLPHVRALGDIDEDAVSLFSGSPEDELDLPPAINAIERRLTLAKLVAAKDRAFSGHERWAGALAAADELGKLLDSFYTEEVDPVALSELAPLELAQHWATSLRFLEIVIAAWPAYLKSTGLMDPADRRVKLIDRQREQYEAHPPETPVIVAGTTGSTPAVARLMKTVSELPQGAVILPGLDLGLDDTLWDKVDEPHPQSGLKELLETGLGVAREEVSKWPNNCDELQKSRSDIINVALRPAGATDSWRAWADNLDKDDTQLSDQLGDIELVEALDEEREADAICLKIREAVATPGKTVFLVTPDRNLGRRVSLKLRRWNINADDSAGVPFANTQCGAFLRLVARWLNEPADSVAFMAVLRHSLFGGGFTVEEKGMHIDKLDLALRGLKPSPGFNGLIKKIEQTSDTADKAVDLADALDLIRRIAEITPPENANFATRYQAHLNIAELLAATKSENGAERLWRGEDGETGAAYLAQLSNTANTIETFSSVDYPQIFNQLIANIAVRRNRPAHPRISILGPLEARLQTADVIILGGLNEGVWPRDAAIDPFLSRQMRSLLGLPSPERRIGLAAHDFAQLSAAGSVMLTRATKTGGKPSTPSRWIVRLKNILRAANLLDRIDQREKYNSLSARLDAVEINVIEAPAPSPPVSARPTEFYVTRIEKLMRDPYAIYARDILKLRKVDDLNEPLNNRHIGNLFHNIYETYVCNAPTGGEEEQFVELMRLYDAKSSAFGLTPAHQIFWRERAQEAFSWFAVWHRERLQEGAPAIIEGAGHWKLEEGTRSFTLSAKSDRIDILSDGRVAIYDYKTGTPPSSKQQATFSLQLPLTALIASHGGFEQLGNVVVAKFSYVKVLNRKGGKSDASGAEGAECVQLSKDAEKGLREVLAHFNDPGASYPSQPRAQFVDDYGDYDHLARRRERHAQDGEE